MSTAYFIVLDNNEPGFDTFVNGKRLSKESGRLKKICNKLGIPTFEHFISYSPEETREMMTEMGNDEEDIEGVELPEQKWFIAQEGLDFVAQLVEHIEANPEDVNDKEGVLEELEEYREVFTKAKKIKAKWNLQIDF